VQTGEEAREAEVVVVNLLLNRDGQFLIPAALDGVVAPLQLFIVLGTRTA
jgi:hypothetical protein